MANKKCHPVIENQSNRHINCHVLIDRTKEFGNRYKYIVNNLAPKFKGDKM